MPFTDGVSSISGRNSRASNVSAATGTSRSIRSPLIIGAATDTLASAGVLSMLKTSTDTGDIGALSFNTSRLPSVPRSARQRRSHVSRPSGSMPVSSQHSYAPSQASRVSSQWDAASANRRGSFTSMQSMPPALTPAHVEKLSTKTSPQAPENARDSRSFSMTSVPAGQHLPRHRSATSLKLHGHEAHQGAHMVSGPMPSMPEYRPPFVYPTRLKRPGYRSPSPALSDSYSQGHIPPVPPIPRTIPLAHPPQAFAGYTGDYAPGYIQDPRHLHVRPLLRTMNSSPGGVAGYEPSPYGYQPVRMHSPPAMPMPYPTKRPVQQNGYAPSSRSPRPVSPEQSPYASPQYVPRPGHGHLLQSPYHTYQGYRGPPPPSNTAPMAHSIFHNAARLARQLPVRTETPLTDTGPPSSEPPSSGSAPSSSNPPTPKDHSTIEVTVDPAFIDPALADLPDSSSEPVMNAKYFEYADGLERPMDDTDLDLPHPSAPPYGFVQRVKAMLESRAVVDATNRVPADRRALQGYNSQGHDLNRPTEDVSDLADCHELAANETPRFTIIEEFEAPVELPASPVKVPELEAEPVMPTPGSNPQRITREMVQAELGPSSVDVAAESNHFGETHRVVFEFNERQIINDAETETINKDHEQALADVSTDKTCSSSKIHADNRKECAGEIATDVNIETTLSTGANLALRFSEPVDTTLGATETHSKDQFPLDADTITIEQRGPDEPTTNADRCPGELEQNSSAWTPERRPREEAVSSIGPEDEGVTRRSDVSPMQTQTIGVAETLADAVAESKTPESPANGSSIPGAFPEEASSPPTPRIPKIHSRSVQIVPSVTSSDRSSNRYSLPGDLSTIGETTMNSGTEMVTDIAVRFSLPQTTITISKPQMVDLPSEHIFDRPRHDEIITKHASHAVASGNSKRHSVTFADDIAPLHVAKKQEPIRAGQGIGEAPPHKGKSIIRKPPAREDTVESNKPAQDRAADSQFPLNNDGNVASHHRFNSTHLPGLKEESTEDMSLSDDKRSPDGARFTLPARIAAVKAMQERHLHESAEKARVRRAARQRNRSIAEIRDLPSLNFSGMDLIDKLNDALEIREVRSMDLVRHRELSGIYSPSPQRPQSTELLRERYMSFFAKPDDLDSVEDSLFNEEDTEVEPNENNALVPVVRIQETTQVEDDASSLRPLSPQEFLTVANQVNRLSIPSVSGLSDRISELIPGLRNLSNLHLDSVGFSERGSNCSAQSSRPETALSIRTSAGFRTLAERAEEIVMNGTHDSFRPAGRGLALNKDLPPLPESASAGRVSALTISDGLYSHLSGSASVPADLGRGPSRPSSALVHQRAPVTEDEVRQLLPKEMNPITRSNKRSLILSHPNTSRPWNLDENYPWSESKIDVDLSVPSQAHTRTSVSETWRGRRSRSLDFSIAKGHATETTEGIDIGSITDERMDSAISVTTEQLTGVASQPGRKQSKRSIIGSITRKFGLSGRRTSSDDTTEKPFSKSPGHRQSQTSHRPGDRYPTSSLTPPATFNIDEVRSYFSDNSSEHNRTESFRKRLTAFRGGSKTKAGQPLGSRPGSMEGNIHTAYDAGEINDTVDPRLGATSSANAYIGGIGMSKTEFHIKRIGERLRHLWARGGELIRTFSTRSSRPAKRPHRLDEDWLADSLYSGE